MKNKLSRIVCTALSGVMCLSIGLTAGCKKNSGTKKDAIVIMTEELSGLFNPFYATSGPDQDVIGLTQIGMLSTEYVSDGSKYGTAKTVAGDDYATVAKAYDVAVAEDNSKTVYTFVVKNNLKFSDGVKLTMNDVMFNIYEYLDPVYTGSSTMYSTKILGLSEYRTQRTDDGADSELNSAAAGMAYDRRSELLSVYTDNFDKSESGSGSYRASYEEMKNFILNNHTVSDAYKAAVGSGVTNYNAQLLKDYDYTLETFKKELEADFKAAKESYDLTTAPYKDHAKKLQSDIFKFFLYEGYIKPVYAKLPNSSRDDLTKIERFDNEDIVNSYKTEAAAIDRVYNDTITTNLHLVLSSWGTAGTVLTTYTADARTALMEQLIEENGGQMLYPNIEGIVSLGHTSDVSSVTIGGTTYKVAHQHNADVSPVNSDEYDVLQITIEGVDPKAIYNFGFTVAPAHYYTASSSAPNGETIDIANNKFGVKYANSEFQSKVIQSQEHVEVPVGAGPYAATDKNMSNKPSGSEFVKSNIVYYKANKNYMFPVKTEKLQMQVVSSSNAIDKLEKGEVDYITPQFTNDNAKRLKAMEKSDFKTLSAWQLGYGYIGINAGKVKNVYIRKAIMAAMQTSIATQYYEKGTCNTIDWPMSMVSWAYPFDDAGNTIPNEKDYLQFISKEQAIDTVKAYMNMAGVSEGDSQLKIKFTIAGASITEHPTYNVFKQAQEILNESCGWQVEIKADSQALTKLATGSLEVWAAAWGSTIDPDMYQVYHKDSTATSVYAWGYREIKNDPSSYEYNLIAGDGLGDGKGSLSDIIDAARNTLDQNNRKQLYQEAMNLVLELAVEMPVYQRQTMYAYNSKTVKGFNTTVNPYSSPLEKIWELELVK